MVLHSTKGLLSLSSGAFKATDNTYLAKSTNLNNQFVPNANIALNGIGIIAGYYYDTINYQCSESYVWGYINGKTHIIVWGGGIIWSYTNNSWSFAPTPQIGTYIYQRTGGYCGTTYAPNNLGINQYHIIY